MVPAVPARPTVLQKLLRSRYRVTFCSLALLIIVAAFTARWLAPYDPLDVAPANRLKPPSADHWFGTDELGRDIFSRVLHGAGISLTVSGVSIAIAVVIGAVVGILSGYFGGLIDEVVMRVTDIFLAVPLLVLAMAIAAALGPSLENAIIAVAMVWWPGYARQIRGQVLATKNLLYVEAARSLGAGLLHLNRYHILPNCVDPVVARVTLDVGYVVLVTASLSFIGLGSVPPTPDWGTMMAIARTYILSNWTYPTLIGLAISLSVLILTLAGDALKEAMEVEVTEY
ncbi:MAG: ABC transporter permease [Chloroflexi bacterium]|nr:ABC transporter permease [Chloroflexota bacterium]